MKKSLVALAALAATSAFAQSSVTLSGLLDYAYASQSGSIAGVNANTVSTNIGTSATSVIRFIAVEDIGGGQKVTAQYNLDPRTISNDGSASLARDEVFVGISGGFGNVRLGSPNSISLGTFLASSPLGTGVGSGYVGLEFGLTAVPRYNRSIRYDSPNISGVTLSALYAPGGDEATTASAAANGVPNARKTTEIGASFTNGPLNLNVVQRRAPAASYADTTGYAVRGTNGAVWFPGGAQTATAYGEATWTSLGANYKFGNTTVYAGTNNGDTVNATLALNALKTKGTRLAVKHTMGSIDLIGQTASQTTTSAAGAETKQTFQGIRADYNLSKTAATYIGYEKYDNGAATANDRKIVSLGLRKSF